MAYNAMQFSHIHLPQNHGRSATLDHIAAVEIRYILTDALSKNSIVPLQRKSRDELCFSISIHVPCDY